MLPEDVPNFWTQSVLVTKNPVLASHFFHLCMTIFIQKILRYGDGMNNSLGGVLGQVSAYYGYVEAQGWGSLHCHMLVWLDGTSVNPFAPTDSHNNL